MRSFHSTELPDDAEVFARMNSREEDGRGVAFPEVRITLAARREVIDEVASFVVPVLAGLRNIFTCALTGKCPSR